MPIAHNLGFPHLGAARELKRATEGYWGGKVSLPDLLKTGAELRARHWRLQEDAGIDLIPSNDFSYYDRVLDTCTLVGAVPKRNGWAGGPVDIDTYFAMARGVQSGGRDVTAMEMTKWFDTNYHYLVPEFEPGQAFRLSSSKPVDEFQEAKALGIQTKPVLIGPVTFLLLGKARTARFDRLALLDALLPVYAEVLSRLAAAGATWVRLVELNPGRAGGGEERQDLRVHRQQRVQQREAVEPRGARLAQEQERHRSDEHRLGMDAQRLGLLELIHGLRGRQAERLSRLEFGHEVVVVRVEPLRHFHRRDVPPARLDAARHREVRVDVHRTARPAVALRHGAHQRARIEHPVVIREVVRRDEIDAGVLLQPPVAGAQLGTGLEEVRQGDLAAPVAFGGALQLTRSPEVREAEIVGDGHRVWNLPTPAVGGNAPAPGGPGVRVCAGCAASVARVGPSRECAPAACHRRRAPGLQPPAPVWRREPRPPGPGRATRASRSGTGRR